MKRGLEPRDGGASTSVEVGIHGPLMSSFRVASEGLELFEEGEGLVQQTVKTVKKFLFFPIQAH